MKLRRKVIKLWLSFFATILLGVILNLYRIHIVKNTVLSEFIGISFYLPESSNFDASLYFSYSDKFSKDQVVYPEKNTLNQYRFIFPLSDSIITNFRLDFGKNPQASTTSIDSMSINFLGHTTVLKQKDVFGHIIMNSAAIQLDKNYQTIKFNGDIRPYDPYIVFDPLVKILLDNGRGKWIALLFPFFLLIVLNFNRWYVESKVGLIDLLFILFIICIPLKIAWTTFVVLLICSYSIFMAIRKQRFDFKKPAALLMISLFFVLLIVGRPHSLKAIDHQLAFVLFYVILGSVTIQWQKVARFYVYFILLLNTVLVTASIAFLCSFKSVFGLEIIQYFLDIKTYSGNIREWLYYDHAVFLTFFGLVGLLFLKALNTHTSKNVSLYIVYHVFLVSTIVLVGARISLLIYVVYFINLRFKVNPKIRFYINTSVFLALFLFLFIGISDIDQHRAGLWSVSWEAIKEKPFFGHGLGSSDQVLHKANLMQKANTVIPIILNHSHNQFLTFLVELGFIGTSILVMPLVLYVKRTAQYKSITMVLFILGLCYVFLTESILQTSKPLFVLCFLFTIITSIPTNVISNGLDEQT